MQNDKTIEHTGIVRSVDNNNVIVNIESHPACSSCLASGICDMSESANKQISVRDNDYMLERGQKVQVLMKQSMGYRALFLGYLLPFLIVITILITMTALGVSEPVSGISALLSLFPYYSIIYLKKEKIGKSFSFTIKKQIR